MTLPPHLVSFGHGYSARALAPLLLAKGWQITGTTRDPGTANALRATGITPFLWGDQDPAPLLASATHLLISAAPSATGDPTLETFGPSIAAAAPQLSWVGYLSTTGVYGDHGGAWVDEDTPLTPSTTRGAHRVMAEAAWRDLARRTGLPLHIFRLAGIYGPGRGPFAKVRAGSARQIIKPGQVFSRIHVADIAQALHASIHAPAPGAIYNLCDNDPAPPQDVLAYAAQLLNLPPPPVEAWEEAEMTPMARSFYAESKRVHNDRIKRDLGLRLLFPDYRSGLRSLLSEEQATSRAAAQNSPTKTTPLA
ncbi:SDR family oxidoreductase [Pseudoruegeria sp. SK021]|uniref:SDR family oxidoreductase n=1 Tax=Pseudoruegeria sp. SK021 TaxID=1933035 RepID=UPI000A228043|nr:SDR family oxidoreductase [Pseudoruegeria sp. SK021]OSP54452.1 NAD(P)-dependent oxidoreductase [Pseudoruegeria sp. SK021]